LEGFFGTGFCGGDYGTIFPASVEGEFCIGGGFVGVYFTVIKDFLGISLEGKRGGGTLVSAAWT
jgi:hypothetical protein